LRRTTSFAIACFSFPCYTGQNNWVVFVVTDEMYQLLLLFKPLYPQWANLPDGVSELTCRALIGNGWLEVRRSGHVAPLPSNRYTRSLPSDQFRLTPSGDLALQKYQQLLKEKTEKAAEKTKEKALKRRQPLFSVFLVVLGALLRELFGLIDWQSLFAAIVKFFSP
jgi:hypothetical protein